MSPVDRRERRRIKNNASARERYKLDPTKKRNDSNRFRKTHSDRLNAEARAKRMSDPVAARAKDKELRSRSRDKIRAREERYKNKHPEKFARKMRRTRLRKYGLTIESFEALLHAQGGKCAICGAEFYLLPNQHRHVDHDHKIGIVRGIICQHCNVMIGYARENPVILTNAIEYLNRSTNDKETE